MHEDCQCEYLSECPLFQRFHSMESVHLWIQMYCKGPKAKQCARRNVILNGEYPSITLLPNGQELITLKTVPKR